MKDNHGYITGALLIIGLFFGTGQIAFGSNNLPTSIPDSCSNQLAEQAIPDDGSWLKICWSDPSAPEGSTITKVHLKYAIDHPKPEQLEISLSRDVETLGQVIWDRGALIQGDKLGEAADLDIFNGAPSQGNWCFWIRDTVPGEAGKFEAFTIRPVYAPVEPVPELLSVPLASPLHSAFRQTRSNPQHRIRILRSRRKRETLYRACNTWISRARRSKGCFPTPAGHRRMPTPTMGRNFYGMTTITAITMVIGRPGPRMEARIGKTRHRVRIRPIWRVG